MKTFITLILVLIVLSVAAELTREQKRRCEQYISIFENDSPQIDYGFVENFHNGNGFTSGRSGFTTASGTAHQVVKKYTERKPDNPLAKYLPELKRLADRHSSDVSRLRGYNIAWRRSSRDPLFRRIQDDVSDDLYYR
jgi:chitosanase